MTASHDQMDRVDRARLVESGGARDESPSWNLSRVKQGDTIRVDGESPRGQGQEDVKESESGCFRVQQAQGQAANESTRTQDQGVVRRSRRLDDCERGREHHR